MQTFSDLFRNMQTKKNVSYRRFGIHGDQERPIFHRFEIKGGETLLQAIGRNVTANNTLLQRLMQKGKST